jgi:hypothetical protein
MKTEMNMRKIILAAAAGLVLSGFAVAQAAEGGFLQGTTPQSKAVQSAPIISSNGAAIGSNGGLQGGVGVAERTDNMLQKGPLGSNSEGGGSDGTGASQ